MSQLDEFRRHCARMATALHKPECPSLGPPSRPVWGTVTGDDGIPSALRWVGNTPAPPSCDGCNSVADRALFARLASEVEQYQQGALLVDA